MEKDKENYTAMCYTKDIEKTLGNLCEDKKGKIYVGYPGIGKSTICKKIDNCVDLESSNFVINGKRDEDWYKVYGKIAKHLSDQGKIVFTSAHAELRNYLTSEGIEYTAIYPSMSLKEEWLAKLKERYEEEDTPKNYNAYLRAVTNYEKDIDGFS